MSASTKPSRRERRGSDVVAPEGCSNRTLPRREHETPVEARVVDLKGRTPRCREQRVRTARLFVFAEHAHAPALAAHAPRA